MTAALQDLLSTLEAAAERKLYNRIDFFKPYKKQAEFFQQGATMLERLFIAGNQLGKSEAGAYEVACHLTGKYPLWWKGRRWDRPVRGWAAGETSLAVRDICQKKLCGEAGVSTEFGTGFIPRDSFSDNPSKARGVTDVFDTLQVDHYTAGKKDGVSILRFKSYEQGRQKFQGETLDFIWFDEEPDEEIYTEGLTRTNATGGMAFMTFTPLRGPSKVVLRFLSEPSTQRSYVTMTIYDVVAEAHGHYTKEQADDIVSKYPSHQRDARARGIPTLGEGAIFPFAEEVLYEAAIMELPLHWTKLWGIDFGILHNFAAVLTAWDRDNDVIHVAHTIRMKDSLPIQHAAAIKAYGAAVPVAWPQDGTARDKGSGDPLSTLYKKQGLRMLDEHSKFVDGSRSTEAGVMEMADRMTSGRFKVARHLSDWFDEYRFYHRKKGLIVKERDDLLSATRIAVMAKRFGKPVHLGKEGFKRRRELVAEGIDFDLS